MKARSRSSSIPIKRSRKPRLRRGSAAQKEKWTCEAVLRELQSLGETRNVEGMARFGIVAKNVYGVSKPKIDVLARQIGRNRPLALELWDSGMHDARILAGMIDDASQVTGAQMEKWVRHFDNWDVCDGTCCHLFVFCAPAWQKAIEWSSRNEEFVKRAGFALMAYLAYRDKSASDAKFLKLLSMIEKHSYDERNFVRKAVNWALRNIGKRNGRLNRAAIRAAERIRRQDSRAARWIAADALRELKSDAVQARLRRKAAA
jgi:3-methyladenine DNA glycosylase AlkD